MKIQIVCYYEDVNSWILGKFAKKLNEELRKLGVNSNIGKTPDLNADVNHHIIYLDYNGQKTTIDTLMITHVNTLKKVNKLKKQLDQAAMGICMSRHTLNELIDIGLPSLKLCYVNPAHDGVIKPRPTIIGITSKVFIDYRKLENTIIDVCKEIEPSDFQFKIMGSGWNNIVEHVRKKGFKVDYYDSFDYNIYKELVPTFDYYLYFGKDEGSMGFIDALAAGVPTIVTPQGFHLDANGGIAYPILNTNGVISAFKKIDRERKKLTESVAIWTWSNYALKHVQIWEYLLDNSRYTHLIRHKVSGNDGIMSVSVSERPAASPLNKKFFSIMILIKGSLRTNFHNYKNGGFTIRKELWKRIVRVLNWIQRK